MKAKGVNWKNWEKLLEFLKTRRPKQINMRPVLRTEAHSVRLLRKINPACGTVGCIAGWGSVLWGTNDLICDAGEMLRLLDDRLRLNYEQGQYVVQGAWAFPEAIAPSFTVGPNERESLGKREVIRYMTKALKERNVMVKL